MSDDFDKLRPTGDEDDSEDESLDWQKDKPKKSGGPSSGDDLGFTGELSWRADVEDAFDEQLKAANEDAFDWQQRQQPKSGTSSSSGGLGFTGQLDWKKTQSGGDVPDQGSEDDSLDWLRNADDEAPAPEAEIDLFADAPVAQETEAAADEEDDPLAWMNQYGDDLVNEEPAPAEASFFDDEDDEMFAAAPGQIDAPVEQDDPLSWLNQFSAADDAPVETSAPPSSASWLDDDLADVEPAAPSVPSWLDSEADVAEIDSSVDVPSWLSDAAPTEKPLTEGGKLSADWLAGAEDAPESSASEIDFDQWQRIQDEMTRPRDLEEEMPDLFSQFSDESAVSDDDLPVKDTGELPSWVLGMQDLNADDAPDWLKESEESEPAIPEPDDIFAELGLSDPEPTYDFSDQLDTDDEPDWLKGSEESEPAIPEPDDIFAELGLSDPEPTYDFSDQLDVDDLLAGLNLGGVSDTPDWLNESAPAASTSSAAPVSDDIFGELGLPTPETGYDFLDQPEEDDLLAGLNLGGASDTPDWFAEVDEPAVKDTPDWLTDLGDLSEAAQAQTLDVRSGAIPADDDFMAAIRDAARQPTADIDPMDTSGLQDIDSLLASYDSAPTLPSTGELMGSSADLDRLLSENEMQQISSRRGGEARPSPSISGLSPDAPDWLTELGANVDEVSAAAIVRKQTQRERPLDELSDRLQALHERGLDMPTSEDARPSEVLRTLLPGVTEVLSAAPLQVTTANMIGDLVLSDAQRQKMNLLKTLVGTDEDEQSGERLSAIDRTLATPSLADLGDEEPDFGLGSTPTLEPAPVSRRPKRRRLPKFDRILIGLFLAVAVILPYVVSSLRIGDLPPAQFAAGSRELAVFNQVDSLQAGDLALIAAEYGPTGAGELDPALDALLRHVLLRGARPVIVSGNPVGLLHAGNVLNQLTGDAVFLSQIDQPALQANQDYYVVRYLAASTIGLRAFSQDIPGMLAVDTSGQATNLHAASLQDFALIAVVAENAEEIRGWAEQIAPLAGQPILALTGQSAAPLSEPYVLPNSAEQLTGLSGLLVGYRDAYTYRAMLDAGFSGGRIPLAPAIDTPTRVPTEETPVAPTPTVEGGAVIESTDEIEPTEAVTSPTPEAEEVTNTPPPTPTITPTNTPAPSATATDTPTATLTPSVTPTFEPGLEVRGVIDSDQAVNVREGPARTFAPIASLTPGTIVQITGRNGDGTWLKIALEDGSEGWVSASLVAVEEAAQTGLNIDLSNQMVGLVSDVSFYAPALQDEATPEVTAEANVESTAEATAEATLEPTPAPPTPIAAVSPPAKTYRDERWYGMTLGLVAIIVVITIGMIANIVRSLFRRGK